MSPTTNQEPPISDPVVMIGARTYTVVYDLRAEFKLSEWDLDPRKMMEILWKFEPVKKADGTPEMNENGTPKVALQVSAKSLSYILNLWAACVAHNFSDAGEIAPTGEQWSIRINSDPGAIAIISKALYEAMGKRFRERMQGRPQPVEIREASSSAPN